MSIEVQFTAHDASNYTMTAESSVITLTYLPVNDPPEFLGTLKGVRVKPGEEWNITLEDYFRDDDTGSLRFSSNNPNVKIIELNKTRHCAVWKPDRYSNDVTGLIFTAYDGRTYTRSDPITLDFEAPAGVDEPPPVTNVILRIPLYVYILLPAGILAGVAAFGQYTSKEIESDK